MIPVVSIVGFSSTGKTRLVRKLIEVLKNRGYRVAAIKHAAHGYDLDSTGKDSWHYYQAGADQVLILGPESLTVHTRHRKKPALREVCERIEGVDLVLAEGFKGEPGPKIEVFRKNFSPARLSLGGDLIAVVSDLPLQEAVPCFSPNEVEKLADFIIKHFLNSPQS
ncbi:MAG: molybdopterin-guanine dinucleotide biosynthesis protein B [Firmicutes bacterium]|nr:molybdopterin-guanine dinucleotide biosynthesis protein B [Bacillota bacterium]